MAVLPLLMLALPLLPFALKQHVHAHTSEITGELVTPWRATTVRELHAEYANIFRHGNRNAASHLWSSFLLDRARFLTTKEFLHLASGYCAISGSPVHPSASTRYRMSLERVDGSGKVAGSMYYCCWPCVCDTNDFIRVDTKTVATSDQGARAFNVSVIGDPCLKPGMLNMPFLQPFDKRTTTIAAEAREVRCGKQGLEGASYSDHGYVVIGLYFAPGRAQPGSSQDGASFRGMCDDRAAAGYNSGMGEIFRQVAAISPVEIAAQLVAPSSLPPKQLAIAARRQGVTVRGLEKPQLVAALEKLLPARLRSLKPRALRAAAARLGVSAPPVTNRAQKEVLVGRLAEALRAPSPPPPPLARAELAKMSSGELAAEATRRGLDRRRFVERADLLRLLGFEEGAEGAEGAEEVEVQKGHSSGGEAEDEATAEESSAWVEAALEAEEMARTTSVGQEECTLNSGA